MALLDPTTWNWGSSGTDSGPGTGILGFLSNNSNAFANLGAGIASSPYLGQGLSNAAQGIQQANALDYAANQKQRAKNATAKWLQTRSDIDPATKQYLADNPDQAQEYYKQLLSDNSPTADEKNFKFAVKSGYTGSYEDWLMATGRGMKYGLQPQAYIGKDGQLHYAQIDNKGGAVDLPAPNGGSWAPPVTYHDTGTSLVPTTKYGGSPQLPGGAGGPAGAGPGGVIPKDVAGEAQQKAEGGVIAGNRAAFNQADQRAAALDDKLAAIAQDPRLDKAVGGIGQFDPMHPIESANRAIGGASGTDTYDFRAKVKEAVAGEFGAAIPQMRNLGSLSNAEGEKVATELGNLDPNMSPDAFRKQLNVVRNQIARLRQAMKADLEQQSLATGAASAPQVPDAPPQQPGPQSTARKTKSGVTWGY